MSWFGGLGWLVDLSGFIPLWDEKKYIRSKYYDKKIIDYLEQKNVKIEKDNDILEFQLEKNVSENGIAFQINVFLNSEPIFIYNKKGNLIDSNIKCDNEISIKIFQLLKEKVADYAIKNLDKDKEKISILKKFLQNEETSYFLSNLDN